MKSNIAGLIMALILIVNIFCLLIFFLLKFWKHDRRLDESEDEKNEEHPQ